MGSMTCDIQIFSPSGCFMDVLQTWARWNCCWRYSAQQIWSTSAHNTKTMKFDTFTPFTPFTLNPTTSSHQKHNANLQFATATAARQQLCEAVEYVAATSRSARAWVMASVDEWMQIGTQAELNLKLE